jgi:hypothetical protein
MRFIKFIVLIFATSVFAQPSAKTELLNSAPLKVDQLIGVDNFDTRFYLNNDAFFKYGKFESKNYSNVQLGTITSANTFNPLKINLLYRDFNSIVILDNRLAEITKVDFNSLKILRVVTHITTGNDNAIWLYDQNTQQLELFDYLTRKTKVKTLPSKGDVLDLTSNFNFVFLLTDNYLYKYNYTGSLIFKIENTGYSEIVESNDNIVLKKGNLLFFKAKNKEEFIPIKIPELLINQFLVTNETLYIYADEILHQFQLKID